MNNLHETLEICLQDIEQGADLETVLFRYPDLADELRPILETAMNARNMAIPAPSAEVVRRNRVKVLQHAAEIREAKARSSSRRFWFASLRRVVVTLVVIIALFVSGTGLVRAASTTLPGDNLYPVKRTWEDVLVLFTFNMQQRQALEVEHENERLSELQDLFAEGRSAKVDFAGVVTYQSGTDWVVAGIPVVISVQTELPDQAIVVGSAVHLIGRTQDNKVVLAQKIELLPPGAQLPEAPDEPEMEQENHEGSNQQIEDNSGKASGEESPNLEGINTPASESKLEFENSGSGSDRSSGTTDSSGSSNDSSSQDSGTGDHSDSGGGDH